MHRRRTDRLLISVTWTAVAAVVLTAALLGLAVGQRASAESRAQDTASHARSSTVSRPGVFAPSEPATISLVASPALAPSSTATVEATAQAAPQADVYRGLGSWVDLYDTRAWNNPPATVRDMARHGVHTLYIETSNSRSHFALKDATALRSFIREAHVHNIHVVAWYLPDLRNPSRDYARIAQAINLTAAQGQKFDSFALDIESGAVRPVSTRNQRLLSLSAKIRALVGPSYPLGAIIPSPVGLSRSGGYWQPFPYTSLSKIYDAFVPMSYYTYHVNGYSAVYADTAANVRIIRAQAGCSAFPIHLIGGIADDSSRSEVAAFVKAVRDKHVFGASLYGWPGTTAGHWAELRLVPR